MPCHVYVNQEKALVMIPPTLSTLRNVSYITLSRDRTLWLISFSLYSCYMNACHNIIIILNTMLVIWLTERNVPIAILTFHFPLLGEFWNIRIKISVTANVPKLSQMLVHTLSVQSKWICKFRYVTLSIQSQGVTKARRMCQYNVAEMPSNLLQGIN